MDTNPDPTCRVCGRPRSEHCPECAGCPARPYCPADHAYWCELAEPERSPS